MLDFVSWIPQRVWEAVSGRRQLGLLVHHAYFAASGRPCYFLNLTNLSRDRELEVTHVWFAVRPEVHARPPDRSLPKRLKPDETWETWVKADRLPANLGERVFTLGRARLSTGRIIRSRKNRTVPSEGTIPGGPINLPPT